MAEPQEGRPKTLKTRGSTARDFLSSKDDGKHDDEEEKPGYLLVVDMSSVDTSAEHRDLDASNPDHWRDISRINRRGKATLLQVQRLVNRLINSNFVLVQNTVTKIGKDGEEIIDKWFIRITMEERDLMVAADKMGMMKRLKEMYVPDENGLLHTEGHSTTATPIPGAYLPFTIARAHGWAENVQTKTVGEGVNIELEYAIPFMNKGGLSFTDGKHKGGIFEEPRFFGKRAKHFSCFTQSESLEIIMYTLQHTSGLDVEYKPDSRAGSIELWKKRGKDDYGRKSYDDDQTSDGLIYFSNLSPYHTPAEKRALEEHWALALSNLFTTTNFCKFSNWSQLQQPIDAIKDYFGQKTALYFTFVGFILRSLCVPAVLSIVIFGFVLYSYDEERLHNTPDKSISEKGASVFKDSPAGAIYSVMIIVWATFMMELWKRRDHSLSLRWGTAGVRFQPVYRKRWLKLYDEIYNTDDPEEVNPFKADEMETKYFDLKFRPNIFGCYYVSFCALGHQCRLCIGAAVVVWTVVLVLAIVFGIMLIRLQATINGDEQMVYASAALNGLAIQIVSMCYVWVARRLSDWENHRTNVASENSYITKTFSLEFINNYISLFYIAFVKKELAGPTAQYFGSQGIIHFINSTSLGEEGVNAAQQCLFNSCMYELFIQLSMLMLFKAVAMKIFWVAYNVLYRLYHNRAHSGTLSSDDVKWYQYEDNLPINYDVTNDYKEIAVYYGYIVLFAAAFPLAPLFALIVLQLELRTDAHRFLHSKRLAPQTVGNIGEWYQVMEVVTYIAVATNCGIIVFTSNYMDGHSNAAKLGIFLIAEHMVFALRMSLEWIIPDVRKTEITRLYKEKEKLEWLHRCIKYRGFNGRWEWVGKGDGPPPGTLDPYDMQNQWRQHTALPESAEQWIWKFSGEYDGHRLTDVCNKTSTTFIPPGQGSLSKGEMNRLQLDQLILAESNVYENDETDEPHGAAASAGGGTGDGGARLHMLARTSNAFEAAVLSVARIQKLHGDDLTLQNIMQSVPEGVGESYGDRRERVCPTPKNQDAAVIDLPDSPPSSTELGLIRHESKQQHIGDYPVGEV